MVLLGCLFGLGLLAGLGYQRYRQIQLPRQNAASPTPMLTPLAERAINFRVASNIPGITATLSPEGTEWIKQKMEQINYPPDKSFVVLQNGRLTPVYPEAVAFVFESINPIEATTRENTLYERTRAGGETIAGMQSALVGNEAVYTIFLKEDRAKSDSDQVALELSYRMLRTLFAATNLVPTVS